MFAAADGGEEPEVVDKLQELGVGLQPITAECSLGRELALALCLVAAGRHAASSSRVSSSSSGSVWIHGLPPSIQSPYILRSHVGLRHLLVPIEMRPQCRFARARIKDA